MVPDQFCHIICFFLHIFMCFNVYLGYIKLSKGLEVPNRVGNRSLQDKSPTQGLKIRKIENN